ncbi:MAG: hypothetical protein PWP76_716 [Candidatus Diapherotrites archaeon]|nr:hypothetical protein [Candidatus Diapherotrites archaeon]
MTFVGFQDYLRTRYFRNLGPRFIISAWSKLVGLIITIYLARFLGPAQLGYFSFVASVAGVLATVFSFGLPGYIQRHVAFWDEQQDNAGSLVSAILSTSSRVVALSIIFSVALGIFANVFLGREAAILLFTLAGLYSATMILGLIFESILIALHRLERAVIPAVVRDVLRLILVLALVYFVRDFVPVVLAYTFVFGFYALLLYRVVRKHAQPSEKYGLNVLIEALPFLFFGIAHMLLAQTDVIMLSALRPMEAVGYYKVAQLAVTSIISVLPIVAVSLPTLSRATARGQLKRTFFLLLALSSAVSVAAIAVFYFVGPPLILFFFGDEYMQSIPIFYVLLFLIPTYFVYALSIQGLIAIGREREQVVYPLVAGILNVVLNYLFILQWGAVGAAMATVTSIGIAGFVVAVRFVLLAHREHL